MSQTRVPGSLDPVRNPRNIQDGTSPLANGPFPGPSCSAKPSGIGDTLRRVKDVRLALWWGIDKYAYKATLAKLGEDLKLILDSLWPGFLDALKVYAWSVGIMATLGGIAGALVGGVGAIPGAALGAQLGVAIGTFILTVLGLKFLIEYVLAHLAEANEHFGNGFKIAWEACGNSSVLDLAAKEFGNAIAALVSLFLEAAAAYVLKKGLQKGLEQLNKSKAGQALVPYAKVQYWREKLGVTDAPVPRKGIATTIAFFEKQVAEGKLDKTKFTTEKDLLSYWKAKDFSKEIKVETLQPGKELVAYRDPSSPFGFYYAEVGSYLDKLGVDYVIKKDLPAGVSGPPALLKREYIRYRVKKPVEVLRSTASGVRAHDTKAPVSGGATQYFIPRSWEMLEVIPSSPKGSKPIPVLLEEQE